MSRTQNRVLGKAPTVAVIFNGAGNFYQIGLLRGIEDAAAAAGVTVLCFVGGGLPLDPTSSGCARHRIYDLCGPHNVDGVILFSSTVNHEVGAAGLARHCEKYKPLPILSIGVDFDGAAGVTVDNSSGMKGVVSHLIEAHGARRIAFVRGPNANAEAEARLNAYRAALEEHGIPFEPSLVLPGDFTADGGAAACRELLKSRGGLLDGIDGIAAANDAMAIGVLTVLEKHGLEVPRRLAVVGFDDLEEGRLTRSPLTTVRQPLEKIGRQAMRSFLDCVQFGDRPVPVRLDTELVVRRSCGCGEFKPQLQPAIATSQRFSVDAALMMRRQTIIDALTRIARGSFGAAGSDWQARLVNAVAADARDTNSAALIPALQDIMDKISLRGVDLSICDELLTTLRRQVLEAVGEHAVARQRLEDDFHSARLLISETLRRELAREHLQLSGWSRTLSEVCSAISSTFDTNKLAGVIQRELPRLGIQCCFVVLYEGDPNSGACRLVGGYDQRSGEQWGSGIRFVAKSLIPRELMHAREGRSFVVMPLSCRTRFLGHMLMELDLEHSFADWPIVEAVSTALRAAEFTGGRSETLPPPAASIAPS